MLRARSHTSLVVRTESKVIINIIGRIIPIPSRERESEREGNAVHSTTDTVSDTLPEIDRARPTLSTELRWHITTRQSPLLLGAVEVSGIDANE